MWGTEEDGRAALGGAAEWVWGRGSRASGPTPALLLPLPWPEWEENRHCDPRAGEGGKGSSFLCPGSVLSTFWVFSA